MVSNNSGKNRGSFNSLSSMGGFRWDGAVDSVKKHNTGRGNLQDKSAAVPGKAVPEPVPGKNAFTVMRHESGTGLEKKDGPAGCRDRPSFKGDSSILHRSDQFEIDHRPVAEDDESNCYEARNSHRRHARNAVAEVAAAGDDCSDSHQDASEEHRQKLRRGRDLPFKFLEGEGAQPRAEGHGEDEEHAPGTPEYAQKAEFREA